MSENLQKEIDQELQNARQICDVEGASSSACAAAWDAVEELQAAASDQRQEAKEKTSLETYCDANPEAVECRVYES